METKKVAAGSLLLAVSFLVFAESGAVALRGPLSAAAVGAVAVSAGSLLLDAGGV